MDLNETWETIQMYAKTKIKVKENSAIIAVLHWDFSTMSITHTIK